METATQQQGEPVHQQAKPETLDDIIREGEQPAQPEPGQQDSEPDNPVQVSQRLDNVLVPLGTMAWKGGCELGAWATEVEQLKSSDPEALQAGQAIGNILDAVLPAGWLENLDPNGAVAVCIVNGVVLYGLINQKQAIYAAEMQRRAELDKAQQSEGGASEEQKP